MRLIFSLSIILGYLILSARSDWRPCPLPIGNWTQGSQDGPAIRTANSYFCFVQGATDKATCKALNAIVSDIRDDGDRQVIFGYLKNIIDNSDQPNTKFQAVIGLVKKGGKYFGDDDCLKSMLQFQQLSDLLDGNFIESATDATYILDYQGKVRPSTQPAELGTTLIGIVCRYDKQPCNRAEYVEKCSTGQTCMANDSCFSCENQSSTNMLPCNRPVYRSNCTNSNLSCMAKNSCFTCGQTTTTSTTMTTTKLTTTTTPTTKPKIVGVQTAGTMYSNPFALTTTQHDDTFDNTNGNDSNRRHYDVILGITITVLALVVIVLILKVYTTMNNKY